MIPNYEIRQETLACISTSSFPSAFENTSSPTGNKRTSSPCSSTPTSRSSSTSKHKENESIESSDGTKNRLEWEKTQLTGYCDLQQNLKTGKKKKNRK